MVGCVLGTLYNQQDPTPTQDSEMWLKKFSNGTEISHNRKTGEVVVTTSGQVTVTAAQVVITGDVTIKGNLQVSGTIQSEKAVSAPSVNAQGVELVSHIHGNSPPPNK